MARKLALLIVVLYPVSVLVSFFMMLRIDAFALFGDRYQFPWLLLVPGVLILLTIGLAFMQNAPRRWMRFSMMVWIGVVTWGHHSLIEIAASGV